jgi:hypothetical protein
VIVVLNGKGFHQRSKGFARAAPRRPEIHQYGFLRLENVTVKSLIIDFLDML